uniref:Putative HNH homing endonuclease n=1 Tax=viral metagenome TaxID=1070528 RepID=A0A6M3LDG9_9ZZZZ
MYSETDKAYLAGFIDGEGTIVIDTHGGTRTPSLRLIVANTYLPVLQELREIWGGCLYTKKPQRENWKAGSALEWATRQALEILKEVQPYLHVKREQCQVAFKFQETVNPMEHRTRGIPMEVQAFRLELKEEMQALNKKGN